MSDLDPRFYLGFISCGLTGCFAFLVSQYKTRQIEYTEYRRQHDVILWQSQKYVIQFSCFEMHTYSST